MAAQKPDFASMGIFVVRIATLISISRGRAASRVSNPSIKSEPQTISTTPTKGAENCGAGMPILINRPTPRAAGNKNFWIPSDKNTQPTISRTKSVAAGALLRRALETSILDFSSPSSSNPQRLLNLPRNPRRERLHLLFRVRFHHHPRQRLGSRVTHHHASIPIQLAFGSLNCPLYLRHLRKRNLLPHPHVLNFLRKHFQIAHQLGQRLFPAHDHIHHPQRGQQTIARRRVAIVVATTVDAFNFPRACRSRAVSNSTPSPFTTRPSPSQNRARSASPSNVTPRSNFPSDSATVLPSVSGCSAPHPSLIFLPSGVTCVKVAWIPKLRNNSGASAVAAPLAQSTAPATGSS